MTSFVTSTPLSHTRTMPVVCTGWLGVARVLTRIWARSGAPGASVTPTKPLLRCSRKNCWTSRTTGVLPLSSATTSSLRP